MDLVLICVDPAAEAAVFQYFERQFEGRNWAAQVIPIDQVQEVDLREVSAIVVHASDWATETIRERLTALREVLGPNQRILALLSRPLEQYPADLHSLWDRALGYNAKITQALEIVDSFVAGRA